MPLLEREEELLREMKVLHMFQETDPTCPCCGHGKRKQMACWACAGFSKAPSKAEMLKRFRLPPDLKVSKKSLEKNLPICHVCGGAPRETRWSFNANSDTQMKILLYDVLKLPKRLKRNNKGKSVLTVDEKALKGLLGGLQDGE